ncbi:MAG TPA: DUF3617 family protein [Casimicrobiaceae bacterium]
MRQIALLLALILGAGLAQAQDVPKRKSGLWEIKVQTFWKEGVRTTQMCVDQKTDNAVRQLVEARRHESCQKVTLRREGDKQLVDAECKLGGTGANAKTHGVITGSFDSAYKIASTSTFDEPVHGKFEGSAVIEARWTGPCQSDQKPGDVILANGTKFNIDEMKDTGLKPRQGRSSAPARKPRMPVPTQ